jgi:hypothetical protein
MLKFTLKYLTFAPICFGPLGPSSGSLHWSWLKPGWVADWVARCTAPSTHPTCCHNTALLITMYFYWLFLQKCKFSQAQCKLPEYGPNGPKHVGANIRYFNVILTLYIFNKRCICGEKKNFNIFVVFTNPLSKVCMWGSIVFKQHIIRIFREMRCHRFLKREASCMPQELQYIW